ncbi:MAG TPA: arginine decarboxylase, pyruvoyl-dependent [Firmicutes bacterium]|nr:arginine decarboxylase, pyruvoyl-dependent [Bacillota bacterium]
MRVIVKPGHFIIVTAGAEGDHTLTAFDKCLLKAGIGNVNLVRISSILPPGCLEEEKGIDFPPGAFVPTAYGAANSEKKGELIAAAVGIGFSEDSFGVIMEHAGCCSAETARSKVEKMITEAFAYRGLALKDMKVKAVEHRVEKAGSVVAAVALW